ncbi:MAG TPA: hypothetical protein VGP63_06895 [Planctomycetaceae bacterium]|nr:hypothetical protein [Planctomycetaceae bacterium]
MRIVVTLAALLALHSGVLAGGLYVGDDAPGAAADAIVPAATAQGECDTSVYHLEHARAGQLIGRVKSLIAQISAYAADEDVAGLPKSVVLLPTSSDDTIIAICPRAHASLVKHAIKSCDALKQYAVKVQLFEVGESGRTVPVGGPHLLIGREGTVQCTTPEESVSVNFKVDIPPTEGNTEELSASETEAADVSSAHAVAACAASGRCHLDCPPPIGEMSVESECDPSGIVHYGLSFTNASESCCESGTCPACKAGSGTCAACKGSSGTCAARKSSSGTCAACKTGSCTADCCKAGCCHGQAQAAASSCEGHGCKCDGTCEGESAQKSHETTNYEETLMESPTSHCRKQFSIGFSFGAGGAGLHFGGPLVWFNKGDEPRCAACETECEVADSDDGHECESCHSVPPAPAPVSPASCQLLDVAGKGSVIVWQCPAPVSVKSCCEPCPATVDGSMFVKSKGKLTGAKVFSVGDDGVYIQQVTSTCGSSCTDGHPTLTSSDEEPALSSPNAPCSCEEVEETQQAPGVEPPALLTLCQHKDPPSGVPGNPHWQEELLKTFRGRRLSDLFEPQGGQTPGSHEMGRLLAEFPKHDGSTSAGHRGAHSLTIVDTPDRVRIFESGPSPVESEKLSETVPTPNLNTCPSCREEFRAFLEEMFRTPQASEDIAQTSHREGDRKATEEARELPNVKHSKIAAVTICYPLRDLVLCDDAGHPVFDTCSIIDHLQSAVASETWSHPSVSIRLDQQSVSLVITQTAEVHQKIADHLRYLRRLQIKQICSLIEHLSGDADESAEPSAQNEAATPNSDVELGTGLPVGR